MTYFRELPNVQYQSFLSDKQSSQDYILVKNIFRRAKIRDDLQNVFKIQYRTGSRPHPFLNKFKPCALTNMSVNYAGSGQYASFTDATPVHMILTLQFQELSPIYAEDYQGIAEGVGY